RTGGVTGTADAGLLGLAGPASACGASAAVMPGVFPSPRPASAELAAAVQRECLRRGLIVELGGRHASVVRLLPPLTITDEQATAVLDRLADAVAAVARGHGRGAGREQQRRRRSEGTG